MSFRAILFITGILLSGLAATMGIPLFVEAFIYNTNGWHCFLIAMTITGFVGSSLALANRPQGKIQIGTRETFITTTVIWVFMSVFAALPFYFEKLNINFLDSCFEAVSALTTTGATILINIDLLPKGILLWRSILQWLGGVGIVVMAMTIFPALRIGGMQLFRSEFSDRSEKILPRVSQIASGILSTYVFFTLLCLVFLIIAGMTSFDAICHSMTAISTGGLSTHEKAIGAFNNAGIEAVLCLFMFIGGSPLVLYVRLWNRDWNVFKDKQAKGYSIFILMCIVVFFAWFYITQNQSFLISLRYSAFSVISFATSTGYMLSDYNQWGAFACLFLFILSFAGGCTGSTTGGIKIFRFQVLFALAKSHLRQLRRPYGVHLPLYQNIRITELTAFSVFTFLILYIFSIFFIAILLTLTGVDFLSSLSGAVSCLGNVGPGVSKLIGPSAHMGDLPIAAKAVLMFSMILGRLELLTVLVLFMPSFWRD